MTRRAGGRSVTFSPDTSALDDLLAGLDGDLDDAVRPAAQAGAQVLYDRVKTNVRGIRRQTGNLDDSIYQAYSKDESGPAKATYHIGWNSKKAPHGGLVEYGHLQRYEYYKREDGEIRPRVRPGMEKTPKPGRGASQAAKDAYYVTREGGPVQVPGKAFVRGAQSEFDRAMDAVKAVIFTRMHLEG